MNGCVGWMWDGYGMGGMGERKDVCMEGWCGDGGDGSGIEKISETMRYS